MSVVGHRPATGTPVPGTATDGPRRDREILARVRGLGDVAAPLIADVGAVPTSHEHAPVADLVTALTRACVQALARPGQKGDGAVLAGLIAELHQLAAELHEREAVERARRLATCRSVLDDLKRLSYAELGPGACEALVGRLGFRRATVLRDEAGRWVPWATAGDGHVGHAAGPDGGLTERIVVAGNVLGLLDVEPGPGRSTGQNRELLVVLADGFGRIHERAAARERLLAQRARVLEALVGAERLAVTHLEPVEDLVAHDPEGAIGPAPRPEASLAPVIEELTPRQQEILRLMVSGATNVVIAEELHITVGTVKSHVKRILRKLRAVNRAQAIAQVLAAQDHPRVRRQDHLRGESCPPSAHRCPREGGGRAPMHDVASNSQPSGLADAPDGGRPDERRNDSRRGTK